MADKPWKREEREAAKLFDGKRFPANVGHRADFTSDQFLGQVKHRQTCSLAQLEKLAVEMEELALQEYKLGVVVVKRRAGSGQPTQRLVIMTDSVWRKVFTAFKKAFGDAKCI